jgi:uncharacterized protein YbaR (Trm112 family)
MTLSPDILAILACPACKGALQYEPERPALTCNQCRLRYPVRDDIPIMLVDEAERIGEE